MSYYLFKNLKVHYSDQGNGPVLVLLHGFLEDLTMWKTLVDEFKKTTRVICVDLLGHGKTENLGYIHSMEDQSEMLRQLLDSLNVKHYAMVGHSMGGYVALAFADKYPDALTGLCLMNSTALADDKEKKRNRDRGIRAVKQNHKTFIRLSIPNLFAEENRDLFSEEILKITDAALKMTQQGVIAALEGMKIRKDRTKILEAGDFPILMIIGKKDPALDYQSLLQQSELGKVKKVVFEDGHMSHIENTTDLIKALKDFSNAIKEE